MGKIILSWIVKSKCHFELQDPDSKPLCRLISDPPPSAHPLEWKFRIPAGQQIYSKDFIQVPDLIESITRRQTKKNQGALGFLSSSHPLISTDSNLPKRTSMQAGTFVIKIQPGRLAFPMALYSIVKCDQNSHILRGPGSSGVPVGGSDQDWQVCVRALFSLCGCWGARGHSEGQPGY